MFDIISKIKFKLFGKKKSPTTEDVYGKKLTNSVCFNISPILYKMKNGKKLTIAEINDLLRYYFKLNDYITSETYKLNTDLSAFAIFNLNSFDFRFEKDELDSFYFILNEDFLNMDITIRIKEKDFFELFEPVTVNKGGIK